MWARSWLPGFWRATVGVPFVITSLGSPAGVCHLVPNDMLTHSHFDCPHGSLPIGPLFRLAAEGAPHACSQYRARSIISLDHDSREVTTKGRHDASLSERPAPGGRLLVRRKNRHGDLVGAWVYFLDQLCVATVGIPTLRGHWENRRSPHIVGQELFCRPCVICTSAVTTGALSEAPRSPSRP